MLSKPLFNQNIIFAGQINGHIAIFSKDLDFEAVADLDTKLMLNCFAEWLTFLFLRPFPILYGGLLIGAVVRLKDASDRPLLIIGRFLNLTHVKVLNSESVIGDHLPVFHLKHPRIKHHLFVTQNGFIIFLIDL